MQLRVGHVFARYRVDAFVGRGGAGEVYSAFDELLKRRVALKILRPREGGDAAARTLAEARSAAALNHPNAVSIFDVGEVDGVSFIAMELVVGATLRAKADDPQVSLGEKLRWLVEIASVLAQAHDSGLVHRDVKPENVMVTQKGTVKVLDFGIASRKREAASSARVRLAGGAEGPPSSNRPSGKERWIEGTPKYMAPEQLYGDPVDGRSDQYAWGLVAYELLSGHVPGADAPEESYPHFVAPPPLLSQVAPIVPFEVAAAVMRALEIKPEARYASMHDVARALAPFVGVDSVLAPIETARREAPTRALGRPRRRAAPVRRYALGVAIALAGSSIAWFAVRSRDRVETAAAVRAAPPAASTSPAALAFAQGLIAFRDGSFPAADAAFNRAVELDPSLAPAHLRLALGDDSHWAVDAARGHYQSARRLRAALEPREQALLDAAEPLLARDPADRPEWQRRMSALSEAYPDDPELSYYAAAALSEAGELPKALAVLDRALLRDPRYLANAAMRVEFLAYTGDFQQALDLGQRCAVDSSDCAERRLEVLAALGRCELVEKEARDAVAAHPDTLDAYVLLADAREADGASPDALAETMKSYVAHSPPELGPRLRATAASLLAALRGDFDAALRGALEWREAVEGQRQASVHWRVIAHLLDLYEEMGDVSRAGDLGVEFLARREGWSIDPIVDDDTLVLDATPRALKAALLAKRMSAEEYERQRRAWMDQMNARTSPRYRSFLWAAGEASLATTLREAAMALAEIPPDGVPLFRPHERGMTVGRPFLLAGRLQEAIPLLRSAAVRCDAVENPIGNTRAHDLYADALEQDHQRDLACKEYDVVLHRWGRAARSKTAAHALAHARALGCSGT